MKPTLSEIYEQLIYTIKCRWELIRRHDLYGELQMEYNAAKRDLSDLIYLWRTE